MRDKQKQTPRDVCGEAKGDRENNYQVDKVAEIIHVHLLKRDRNIIS